MSRTCLILMATACVIVAACGDRGGNSGAKDVLYIRAGGTVAVVEAASDTGEPTYRERRAVPSGDWSTIVHATSHGGTTELVAADPVSGIDRWRDVIRGRLTANVVSHDGSMVALSPDRERFYRYGRAQTELIIAGDRLEKERRFILDGNFEPEAFSNDGSSLFVISYLPARAPTKYQVRRLDLVTGRVEGVFTPHAELQRAMGGTARIQTASPDGNRLYTLYTVKDGDERHAFVHVLDLENLWAHCIDLPDEFATMAESSTALAVSDDGGRMYAANTSSGTVAEIDTGTMSVTRSISVDLDSRGRAHAMVDASGTLFIGSGPWVVAIDTDRFIERDRWTVPDEVRGFQRSGDPATLYVGLKNRIAALDTSAGRTRVLDPPGVGRIGRLGPVLQPVEEDPILKCAC